MQRIADAIITPLMMQQCYKKSFIVCVAFYEIAIFIVFHLRLLISFNAAYFVKRKLEIRKGNANLITTEHIQEILIKYLTDCLDNNFSKLQKGLPCSFIHLNDKRELPRTTFFYNIDTVVTVMLQKKFSVFH